jgi:serine/threonine protein kinase/WD40 repeat protein
VDPSQDLAALLMEAGVISDKDRDFIEVVVNAAVKAHADDAGETLQAFGGEGEVRQTFRGSIRLTADGVESIRPTASGAMGIDSVPGVEEAPGRYSEVGEYGRGGMGRVLLVQDEHLGRDIAMKELLPDENASTIDNRPSPVRMSAPLMARFLQEARITGQLEHPGIVPVYELGYRQDGTLYYTMKLVRGKTLSEAIKERKTLRDRLGLLSHFADLCNAIAYSHSRGVIHRDLKPANVMVGEFGETVVLDWGLAKTMGKADVHADGMAETLHAMKLEDDSQAAKTQYGQALGTPVYMPPEQAKGQLDQVDERSDVYSLGAVLYEILTADVPFTGKSVGEILDKVVNNDIVPVAQHEPNVPPELAAICQRALHKNPQHRYTTAKDLADEIERFQSGAIVQAHEYTFMEHLRRFVNRHKPIVATTAIATFALITLATGAFLRIAQEKGEAVSARDRAETAEEQAVNQRDEAERQRMNAEEANVQLEAARQTEHDLRIEAEAASAQHEWDSYALSLAPVSNYLEKRDFGRAQTLLEGSAPQHRSWAWGWLNQRSDPALWFLDDWYDSDRAYGFMAKCQFSPNDRYILTHRFFSNQRNIFDLQEGRYIQVEKIGHLYGWPPATQFTPDSTAFTCTINQTQLGLWDIGSTTPRLIFDSSPNEIRSAKFSHDGSSLATYVVTPEDEQRIVVWDAKSAQILSTHEIDRVLNVPAFRADYRYLWNLRFRTELVLLGYLPDNKRIAFIDVRLGVLDSDTGERTYLTDSEGTAGFAPNAQRAAVRTRTNTVEIWQLDSSSLVRTLEMEEDFASIHSMALRPDGEVLATGGNLKMWSVVTGEQIYKTPHALLSLGFSSNGVVVLGMGSGVPQIWDPAGRRDLTAIPFTDESGEAVEARIAYHPSDARTIWDESPIGDQLATVDGEGSVYNFRFFVMLSMPCKDLAFRDSSLRIYT